MGGAGKEWLTSVEVRTVLRISTCDLAHLREAVTIRAERRGNAYCYAAKDVAALRGKKLIQGAGFCRLDAGQN